MNIYELIQLFLWIFLSYYNLFIVYFSPIITFYDISNWYIRIILISFIFDLLLFWIWILLKWKIKFITKVLKEVKLFNNLFFLNILLRFFPILSHIWNFISWYSNNKKIFWLITLVLWYILVFILGNIIFYTLWEIYNSTFSTSWIDILYFNALITHFLWFIILIFTLIKSKKY
jgi:hypothetical protein